MAKKVDFSKVKLIAVEFVEGGASALIVYKSGRKNVQTWAADELGLGDFVTEARKAGVVVQMPEPKPAAVPFVTVAGQPMDLDGADTIKVYNSGGRWQVNVKRGSRGVQGLLASGFSATVDTLMTVLGEGWKPRPWEPGQHYIAFARA